MGTLSTGATFAFWLFYTILILVAYHKLFAVVYFDTAKGLLREFIIAAIAGIILTGISLSKPIVGIVVIIIVALIGIGKAQSGGGKVVIVILAIVACVIVGIVGHNVQKNMDDNEKTEQEIGTEDTSQNYERNEDGSLENNSQSVVIDKKEIRLDDFNLYKRKAEEMEDALGVVAQNAGIDIVYLEEYSGYGFSDGSLIMYDEENGPCIIASYSDLVTISVFGINTDMLLEEANQRFIDIEAERVFILGDDTLEYVYMDKYYFIISEGQEKGIIITMKPWNDESTEGGENLEQDVSKEVWTNKTSIYIDDYFSEANTADRMAELLSYDGYDIVYLENYDRYGLADESLILQNYDIGTCIIAEYSEKTTVYLMGINTDMSLEEADNTLINYMGAVNTPLSYEGATTYNLSNWYYITLYSAGEKGIKIVAEPYWGE